MRCSGCGFWLKNQVAHRDPPVQGDGRIRLDHRRGNRHRPRFLVFLMQERLGDATANPDADFGVRLRRAIYRQERLLRWTFLLTQRKGKGQ